MPVKYRKTFFCVLCTCLQRMETQHREAQCKHATASKEMLSTQLFHHEQTKKIIKSKYDKSLPLYSLTTTHYLCIIIIKLRQALLGATTLQHMSWQSSVTIWLSTRAHVTSNHTCLSAAAHVTRDNEEEGPGTVIV